MNTEQEPPIVRFHDHPDFVGGIKWSEIELKWIEARDQKWREAIAKKDAALERIYSHPVALPKPEALQRKQTRNGGYEMRPVYTAKQLTEAVQEATARGLETAAIVCDHFQARDVGMQPAECALAIRRLIGVLK